MKILNLYAGIGGNRKLWGGEHQVTAIELDTKVAAVYQDLFPHDTVVVGDAHEYLLKHYKEFDIIWASPPCPTHSDIRRCGVHAGQYEALYPDMTLYQEIIFLQNFALKSTKWVIENVKPYYTPLIRPDAEMHRHLFWSNARISKIDLIDDRKHQKIVGSSEVYGFSLENYDVSDKRKALRNMVNPDLAKYIMDCLLEVDLLKDGQQGRLFHEVVA